MRRRRPLALALLLYGAIGIALVIVGVIVGMGLAGRIERLAVSADDALVAAARTTRAAADAFTTVDGSLDEAQASTTSAAGLAREASGTLDSLATAMQISVFGAQPLVALADDFAESSRQADELATALDGVGDSLGETRTDVARIGVEMDQLADDLDAVRDTTEDGGTPPVRLFIGLLLLWLAMPAIGSVLLGLFLWPDPAASRAAVLVTSVGAPQDAPQPNERADVEHHPDPSEHD
jgi:hypothetical protein